jgi:hypothetical protein
VAATTTTASPVQEGLRSGIGSYALGMPSPSAGAGLTRDEVRAMIAQAVTWTLARLVSRDEVGPLVQSLIPPVIRSLENLHAPPNADNSVLSIGPDGGIFCKEMFTGGGAGITALGTELLYKGVFLREYDSDGSIIEPGSETGAGTLKATWDYPRWHE